jgi:hypothetical protein
VILSRHVASGTRKRLWQNKDLANLSIMIKCLAMHVVLKSLKAVNQLVFLVPMVVQSKVVNNGASHDQILHKKRTTEMKVTASKIANTKSVREKLTFLLLFDFFFIALVLELVSGIQKNAIC